MIDILEVLEIHNILLREFGGSHGVRDENALISAIERPFSGFGETEFYPGPEEKAAAVFESIIKNHPFVDGNKRTAYVLMRLVLINYGKDIEASQDEKFSFVISAASGQLTFIAITNWIKQHCITK